MCISACVLNAIRGIFKLHFHLVNNIFVHRRNFVRLNVIQFLLPPMFIVKNLEWVLHDWYNCTCKVNGRADQIEGNKKLKGTNNQTSYTKRLETWTQPCIPPHLSHTIWLALTDANIHSATKVCYVPTTEMEAPVVCEVLEA